MAAAVGHLTRLRSPLHCAHAAELGDAGTACSPVRVTRGAGFQPAGSGGILPPSPTTRTETWGRMPHEPAGWKPAPRSSRMFSRNGPRGARFVFRLTRSARPDEKAILACCLPDGVHRSD